MRHITSVLILFFIIISTANAQVVINEIMYDIPGSDGGREWVEIKNTDNASVDLSDWRFNDGSNHILLISEEKGGQGSFVIGVGEYVILASDAIQFLSEYNGFSGTVIDTVMSLGQQNDRTYTLSLIRSDGAVENTASYNTALGALGDGNSLQIVSGNWIAKSPTAGAQNASQGGTEAESDTESSQAENQLAPLNSGSSFPTEPQIFAYAGEDKNVIVGADTMFEGKSFGLEKKPLINARYVWNFGNGETKEGKSVLHYYKYPGEYAVVLNVSSGEFSASHRIITKAFKADISISSVEDDFIEIFNKTNQELNFSFWQLRLGGDYFTIPKNTIILPNKKLIFSSDITKLDTKNKKDVFLLYPNGTEAVKSGEIKVSQKIENKKTNTEEQIPQRTGLNLKSNQIKEIPNLNLADSGNKTIDEKNQKDIIQTASAISSFSADKKDKQIYKWLFVLFVIIIVSVGIIIYVSDKKEPGDDIEIIE